MEKPICTRDCIFYRPGKGCQPLTFGGPYRFIEEGHPCLYDKDEYLFTQNLKKTYETCGEMPLCLFCVNRDNNFCVPPSEGGVALKEISLFQRCNHFDDSMAPYFRRPYRFT